MVRIKWGIMKTMLKELLTYTGKDWIGSEYGDVKLVFEREPDAAAERDVLQLMDFVKHNFGFELRIVGVAHGCFQVIFVVEVDDGDPNAAIEAADKLTNSEEFQELTRKADVSAIFNLHSHRLVEPQQRMVELPPRETPEPTPRRSGSRAPDPVDAAIITIRPDEFTAVLTNLPKTFTYRMSNIYNVAIINSYEGRPLRIATVRTIDQGNLASQDLARDLYDDLRPGWILVAGIGGVVPNDDLSLGDVAVSSSVVDLTVEAQINGKPAEFAAKGGPLHESARAVVANLPAYASRLADWQDNITLEKPAIAIREESLYGDDEWKDAVRSALHAHQNRVSNEPRIRDACMGSSDRLIKATEYPLIWREVARQIQVFEMEFAGVYSALFGTNIPTIAIRGISDIVGLNRSPEWTAYACQAAAAFTIRFLMLDDLYA